VLDGVPAGLELYEADFDKDIARRKSGAKGTTSRQEADQPQILSGIFEGHTTGAPLAIIFRNENTRSQDYSQFAAMPRPGHADQTAAIRWDDCNDPRGGGHFSGRLTLPVVAAGVVAKKVLADTTLLDETPVPENGIRARIVELGGYETQDDKLWQEAIDRAMEEGDSLGAVIECVVPEIEPGYGEPFWDSVESQIAHAMFAIPGVRGIEFGDGFKAAAMKGSEHNDPIGEDGRPTKNGAGGINGGLTNGAPLKFRVAFKPTSSIAKSQRTFNFATGEMGTLEIKGRHDVCFALRCPVIVEAMTAIALADLALLR
jgi:chorismate synthase